MRIPNAAGIPVPYQIEEDSEGLWLVTNLYSGDQYWTHIKKRTCDCPNYEFVVSDYQGGHCKHMEGISRWLKTGKSCTVAVPGIRINR